MLVGLTPYGYCQMVADDQGMGTALSPMPAWPVPSTPRDIGAWISGCDTAVNAYMSAHGGTTDPPG